MTGGDYFVLMLITLNAGAAVTYGVKGDKIMALYWCFATGLNCCLLALRWAGGK